MKIGRSTSYLSLTFTLEELAGICREFKLVKMENVRCYARAVPGRDLVRVIFGSGRTFRANANKSLWTVQLDPEACGLRASDEVFGMSDARWRIIAPNALEVDVPAEKRPLRKMRPVMEKPKQYVPRTRVPVGLHAPRSPSPAPLPSSGKYVFSEDELVRAKEIFNQAIERGYHAQLDGRGRILYFEQRVGG